MKQLTKNQIKELRSQIDKALLPVLQANGLSKLEAGNCSFNPSDGTFTFKLHGAVEGAPTEDDNARQLYLSMRQCLDLPAMETPIVMRGKTFQITGLDKRCKNALLTADGKPYKTSIESLKWAARHGN